MNLKALREFYVIFRALNYEDFQILMDSEDLEQCRFFTELHGCILQERQKQYLKDKTLPLKRICISCKAKCKKCGEIIQTDENKLIYCKCGAVGIDGAIGQTYARIIGTKGDFEDLCEWKYEKTSMSKEEGERFYYEFLKLNQKQIDELIGESQTEDERIFFKDLWKVIDCFK